MKTKILFIAMLALSQMTVAQILHPVKWSYAAKRTGKDEAVVFLKANIESPWHIYSTKQADGGPIKTSFDFKPSTGFELDGKIMEPQAKGKFEKTFNMRVYYFEHLVIFQQKVKLRADKPVISGTLHFMTCNDQKCLPPEDVDFSIPIK